MHSLPFHALYGCAVQCASHPEFEQQPTPLKEAIRQVMTAWLEERNTQC